MTRTPSPERTRLRIATFAVLALAAAALAGDGLLSDSVGIVLGGDPAPADFGNSGWFEIDFGGEPTGGIVYQDTSGYAGDELVESFGFEVDQLYGGLCCGETADGAVSYDTLFDMLLLGDALNRMDPYCDAEPDMFVRPPEGSQLNGAILGSEFGRRQFARQPAFSAIRMKPAHRSATGTGALVAVLDTGVDTAHPFFAGRVIEGHDFVDDDEESAEAAPDGIDQDQDDRFDEGYGHGTTVAGLVLAAAPDAQVLRIRVLDEEAVGTAGRVAAGIQWAVDHGADVVNLSLGGGPTLAVDQAVDYARSAGVIVVAAAGNSPNPDERDFPASKPGVLAVAGRANVKDAILAPARGVAGPYPEGRWYRGTGTSFGAALVSGGVALAAQVHPGIDGEGVRAELGADDDVEAVRLDLVRLAR